jgi:hypothetical protein
MSKPCTVRKIIKVRSDALGDSAHPVGTIIDFLYQGQLPSGWAEPKGQVFTKEELPELFASTGRTYIIRPVEGWLQRLVRRTFNLAGPEQGLRPNEARMPDLRAPPKRKRITPVR